MKKITFIFLLIALIGGSASAQIFKKVKKHAENKTASEISKKTDKKIEGVFNPGEEKDNGKEAENQGDKDKNDQKTANLGKPSGTEDGRIKGKAAPADSVPQLARKKTEFVPGEIVLFQDSLKGEKLGEFPSKWDLSRGSVENMKFEEENVIGFTTQSDIFPLMDEENYLPEKFTIEFDCYFHNKGNEAYFLQFNKRRINIRLNKDGLKYKGRVTRTNVAELIGWRHIELSFNKRALKVYYEGERLLNIPRVTTPPSNVVFSALSHNASNNMYAMIKIIRIAEGAVPLYDRLVTDGKIVTSDIHFNTNKASLKPESMKIIREISDMLNQHSEVRIRIEGHTDSDGAEKYNQDLSERRAASVREALVQEGIKSGRMESKGWGESKPVDSNATAEGKAKNRRVEFVLLK